MIIEIVAIALTIRDQIEAFKPYIGIIQALRHPGMKNRHFEELTKKTDIQMALTSTLTFKNLFALDIIKHQETIKTIADIAAEEFLIESALDKMMTDWKIIVIEVLPYKNTGENMKNIYGLFYISNRLKYQILHLLYFVYKLEI